MGVSDPEVQSKPEVPIWNMFTPVRSIEMEAHHGDDSDDTIKHQQYQAPSSLAGRSLPIVLTSQVNLIQLQRQLKGLLKGYFEFCNSRNKTRVDMKKTADFLNIHSHFESNNLPYFTFYPKSQKPVKAVIWHLPASASIEDISDGLNFGFDVISVKQMSTTHRSSAEGTTTVNIPLFIITLPRKSKSHEIFKLMSLCHIAVG
jgi:hypothetical protein